MLNAEQYHKEKNNILVILDLLAMSISFFTAIMLRYTLLLSWLKSRRTIFMYGVYFLCGAVIYFIAFILKPRPRVERQSYREIIATTTEQQAVFISAYVMFFFVFKQEYTLSRFVVGLFFLGNVFLCSLFRIAYHNYIAALRKKAEQARQSAQADAATAPLGHKKRSGTQHVYIIGCKSIGLYGGFETFLMNLLKHHENNKNIRYHVACKANGQGFMDVEKLPGAERINDNEFTYCNVHGFLIDVPEIGSAQAIYYDIKALKWACEHIEKNHIHDAVVYILACRVGPFERKYVKRIHAAGGYVFQNPDGHEDWRGKWNAVIRTYWKYSERYAVKRADIVVCDSRNIEEYIKDEYEEYEPRTAFIAYGADVIPSKMSDGDLRYQSWLDHHDISGEYYISVGRFVEENNFEVMIREFMASGTDKDLVIITTENRRFYDELQQKLEFKNDKRIKFVGTVYDAELLKKIRENAYGYFHGHEVGGTNPSLLESLASTNLNLVLGVGFNREVAGECALYWNKEKGNLAALIDRADKMSVEEIRQMGEKAKQRIRSRYSWDKICNEYEQLFLFKEAPAAAMDEAELQGWSAERRIK